MPTSPNPSVLSEIIGEQPIPLKTRQYFRRLLQNRVHELVLAAFAVQEQKEGLTQKQLAGRLEKDAAQISRWLFSAGNWELDTLADLLLGMAVRLNELSVTRIVELLEQAEETAAPKELETIAESPTVQVRADEPPPLMEDFQKIMRGEQPEFPQSLIHLPPPSFLNSGMGAGATWK